MITIDTYYEYLSALLEYSSTQVLSLSIAIWENLGWHSGYLYSI